MKKVFISTLGAIGLDTDTEEVFEIKRKREAISNIRLIEEPTTVIVNYGSKKYELTAEKDDILITFYEKDFDIPVIIVKNKDWVENIKNYEKLEQKRKEEWAVKNAVKNEISCDSTSCIQSC